MTDVIIGVDPHKLSATIEVVDDQERLLGSGRFSTDKAGYGAMRTYVKTWPRRVWAIEGANGAARMLRCCCSRSQAAAHARDRRSGTPPHLVSG